MGLLHHRRKEIISSESSRLTRFYNAYKDEPGEIKTRKAKKKKKGTNLPYLKNYKVKSLSSIW